MSSSTIRPIYRRRSRSASSPFTQLDHSSDDPNWRTSTKRSRPNYRHSPSYKEFTTSQPAEKWDVDQWRRGKRARRDTNANQRSSNGSQYPLTAFPSSSKAFGLSPRTKQNSCHRSSDVASTVREGPHFTTDNVDQLRSNAFWELHRSVTESGEGLVQSMRDWEDTRSRSPAIPEYKMGDRYRRRQDPAWFDSTSAAEQDVVLMENEDEEDIEIVSGIISDAHTRSPSHKKRAFSLGTMDIDLPTIDLSGAHAPLFASNEGSERSSSPIDPSCIAYSSDDEEMSLSCLESSSRPSTTPSLSHTRPSSRNSSLISLPLATSPDVDTLLPKWDSPSMQSPSPSFYVPSSASHSEKAVAALALAMANGAGGLNDYGALLHCDGASAQDESGIGELWH